VWQIQHCHTRPVTRKLRLQITMDSQERNKSFLPSSRIRTSSSHDTSWV
jgi:hypothetical protein